MERSSWWARVGKNEWGPLDAGGLRDLYQAGIIPSDAQVRKGSDGKWGSADKVKGLGHGTPKKGSVGTANLNGAKTASLSAHPSHSNGESLLSAPLARFADQSEVKAGLAKPPLAT